MKTCTICGKDVKYMPSHLRIMHKKSSKEAVQLSKVTRAVKAGVQQKNKPLPCPVEGCTALVVRVDLHLRNIHKLDKDGNEYKKLYCS